MLRIFQWSLLASMIVVLLSEPSDEEVFTDYVSPDVAYTIRTSCSYHGIEPSCPEKRFKYKESLYFIIGSKKTMKNAKRACDSYGDAGLFFPDTYEELLHVHNQVTEADDDNWTWLGLQRERGINYGPITWNNSFSSFIDKKCVAVTSSYEHPLGYWFSCDEEFNYVCERNYTIWNQGGYYDSF